MPSTEKMKRARRKCCPDYEEANENRIDSADIKFYLAARHNPVLKELRLICQHEKIPFAMERPTQSVVMVVRRVWHRRGN